MKTKIEEHIDIQARINKWLQSLGFVFNPFQHLEAAADPNLLRFIVIHDGLAPAWKDGSAFIFAPVGGGKTALRIFSTWNSLRNAFAFFPIPYSLPDFWDSLPPSNFAAHGRQLARACAQATMLALVVVPQRFLRLPIHAQQELAGLLGEIMGKDLRFLIQSLRTGDWRHVVDILAEPALASGFAPPPQRHLDGLADGLTASEVKSRMQEPFSAIDRLLRLVQNQLGYRRIHFLIDGVDGFPESNRDFRVGGIWLAQWLPGFAKRFGKGASVKVFLPLEMEPDARQNGSAPLATWPRSLLQWNESLLVEVLRRRLYVASNGRFDSLDALSSPEIRDLDRRLVMEAGPLPREVLALVQRVFYEHSMAQGSHTSDFLEERDIVAAIAWLDAAKETRAKKAA